MWNGLETLLHIFLISVLNVPKLIPIAHIKVRLDKTLNKIEHNNHFYNLLHWGFKNGVWAVEKFSCHGRCVIPDRNWVNWKITFPRTSGRSYKVFCVENAFLAGTFSVLFSIRCVYFRSMFLPTRVCILCSWYLFCPLSLNPSAIPCASHHFLY